MNNKQISRLLAQVAAALEVKKADRFRIIAYERAAVAIEHAGSEAKDLWDENKLTNLAGIGKNMAHHLDELFRTGKVRHFEKIFKKLPPAMFIFLDLSGIGAKTAFRLCRELKITRAKNALTNLKKAARAGKISRLEGFGSQSEAAILQALKQLKKSPQERMPLFFARQLSAKIIAFLKQDPASLRVDPLGSLRRMTATVGDIDLAVATREPQRVIKRFVSFPQAKKILAQGVNTARIILQSGYQIDLKTQTPDAYGALLQHFTGSKQHNIHLREIGQKKGLNLSEYGIKKIRKFKNSKVQKYAKEKGFYQALSMEWIPPELREDTGEIEAAQAGKVPSLVKLQQIKGDLHLHSDFDVATSHDEGVDSMQIMVKKAISLGYQYLGFSEHNPSVSNHNSKQIIEIIKRKKDHIDKLNYSINKNTQKNKIKILNGLEVDIKPNGALAVSDKGLKLLDYAIVSIHASFQLPKKQMTQRLLAGLDHPRVKILGHPTGRKIGHRESYEVDWEQIFTFCRKRGLWLEINAWPDRLDLPDFLVRQAVKSGVKMIINTDAHAVDNMEYMPYGVAVARRGWAKPEDIINTLTLANFNDRLDQDKNQNKEGR